MRRRPTSRRSARLVQGRQHSDLRFVHQSPAPRPRDRTAVDSRSTPVTKLASRESRKPTTAANSSARRSAQRRHVLEHFIIGAGVLLASMGVAIMPGEIEQMRAPVAPNAAASRRTDAAPPRFAHAYASRDRRGLADGRAVRVEEPAGQRIVDSGSAPRSVARPGRPPSKRSRRWRFPRSPTGAARRSGARFRRGRRRGAVQSPWSGDAGDMRRRAACPSG